ncbi:MAG: tetratricopeptide repeat protein [Myxococcales bacterium]|nr:tetratricopeptide repeat protein [Myxococcota bacterium]MDW8282750.1 tetratricopeptide repeat protein [Myxococcales bacterium]
MQQAVATEISRSLAPLRDVVHSLRAAAEGRFPEPAERRRLVRRARQAGAAVLPSLLRALSSASEGEAAWAMYLLRRLGNPRVVSRLRALLAAPQVDDRAKARALGLLADLKVPPPQQVVLRDPEALLETSVHELISCLGSRLELRQAVELVLEHVPAAEIAAFVREVIGYGGEAAWPLLEALLRDPRTPRAALAELQALAQGLPRSRGGRDAQALNQALASLRAGKLRRARRQLESLRSLRPHDPEVASALGVCLLELGLPGEAMVHLQHAAELEPGEALHLWNLSSAARSADRLGACYRWLQAYLQADDHEVGAAERRREAQAFCQAYEAMLMEAYPDVPLERVLAGEELFAHAYAALSAARYEEATWRFREVISLLPRHYPSWGNLGAAYLAMDRTEEALHCLTRALELNPNYTIARENLALLQR